MNHDPLQAFLDALVSTTGKPVVPTSQGGYISCCPAHDDRTPSLSIDQGEDERVLCHCHAGCSFEQICEAVGLRTADLFPGAVSTSTQLPDATENTELCRPAVADSDRKTFPSVDAARQSLESHLGPATGRWDYCDANGRHIGTIFRFDRTRKTFRPVSRTDGGWLLGGMPEPRPLFHLPELTAAKCVFVTEGEKAADAVRSLGLVATTSPHGSNSAAKADWTPLAGKDVVVLPDNDEAGRVYAEAVVEQLERLDPHPVVRVVELPGLGDSEDAVEWIDASQSASVEEIRAELESLVETTVTVTPASPEPDMIRFQPFPTHLLPEPVRGFIDNGARAIGCDPSYLALPMLSCLAAAIGNTRRLELKRGWTVPSIIWTAIIGESGAAKSPAFRLVTRLLTAVQERAFEKHSAASRDYENDLANYEKRHAKWRSDEAGDTVPPSPPISPVAERYLVSDTTVEALAPLLLENPRGLLLARDELSGWLRSFDRYTAGKNGADAAAWLSMFNGETLTVDRKTGKPRTIFVPNASVSVAGGIQPGILSRSLGIEHRESGLLARLLLACPPRKPKRWTEADIDPTTELKVVDLFKRLLELRHAIDREGRSQPEIVGVTPDAKAAFKDFYDRHAEEQTDLCGDLAAAWAKLEEYAARFALVIHFARWAADDPTLGTPDTVDLASMEAGIGLAEWFKQETRRVYALLSESDADRDRRRLMEWIERRNEPVTARDVQRGCRWLSESAEVAEHALQDLVDRAFGRWRRVDSKSRGGRPTREFVLNPSPPSTQPQVSG